LFILADSPPERDIQWSDSGMLTSYKFIQKLSGLTEKIFEIFELKPEIKNEKINIFTNQVIDKANQSLQKFRYNLLVALFHEVYSFFRKISEENKNFINLKENYKKILIVMLPIIPHFSSEYLSKLNEDLDFNWPVADKNYLTKDEKLIVIQVNGKKRNTILIKEDLNEDELTSLIRKKLLISKYLNDRKILKTVYVKHRLINFIIKE